MWPEKHRDHWRIRDRVGDAKVTISPTGGYPTKAAAEHAIILLKADELRGESLVPRGGETTLGEFCTQWWADQGEAYNKVRSGETIAGNLDRYIIRLIGHLELGEIEQTPAIVQRWVRSLLRGETKPLRGQPRPLSPTTVRNAHGLLHQIMDAAIHARLIRSNPCTKTKLPEKIDVEMMFVTPAEADRLIAAMPEHYRPLIVFLLATGCRWGEAIGLRARNLDVLARKVRIIKQTAEHAGQFYDEDPKSRRGRRTITFTSGVAGLLIPLSMIDEDRERRIFMGPRGGMIARKRFYPVWHRATAAAGLTGLRIHDLRHSHATWLIAANIPMAAISRRLGHKSISVTDGRYGHLMEDMNERIVDGLADIMRVIDLGGNGGATSPTQPLDAPVIPLQTAAQDGLYPSHLGL